MEEKVIETKICKFCSEKFDITDKDLEFYNKVSPIFNGKKYNVPTPTLCPECRLQRRLSFRNERNLYKRNCDATGKSIISIYSPDKNYKVYEQEEWWSDKWDALDYGFDFDFGKSAFEQYEILEFLVPKKALVQAKGNVNTKFGNHIGGCKDSYMIFDSAKNVNCMYSNGLYHCEDCMDCSFVYSCINCYFCITSKNCYNLNFSSGCENCNESIGLINCKNCSSCMFSSNLNNKKFVIFNEQYNESEFNKIKDVIIKNTSMMDFLAPKQIIVKSFNGFFNENVTGEYINNSSNVFLSYECSDLKDSKFCSFLSDNSSDCYDVDGVGFNLSLSYECATVLSESSKMLFTLRSWNGSENNFYCTDCRGCKDVFLCTGLKDQQYCILNKQYTKEEYESLVPRIIEHMIKTKEWGEFFPSSISPFGYNETVAMEYYPMDRRDAINRVSTDGKQRFKWSTYENPAPIVSKTIPASKLPDNIKDIPDDILNWAILPDDDDIGNALMRSDHHGSDQTGSNITHSDITFSENSGNEDGGRNACLRSLQKPFRIIKQELEFYRKHNLPIPRRHPDQRHLDRMKLRNPRKLYDRNCDKCNKDIKTTYSPERPEIVYCEECYLKEVV